MQIHLGIIRDNFNTLERMAQIAEEQFGITDV
jgi:hypothetical protein